ncbi:MAG: hypothetical protein U1A27_08225 [Phycisphaerae bacterium]
MHPLLVIAAGLCLFAGLLVALQGLRGRRVGQTPYCGHCGYDLTGLPLDRCPECGMRLADHLIDIGRYEGRRWPLRIGVALLVLGAAPFLMRGLRWLLR